MPDVTVVIPTRNRRRLLRRTLQAVLGQAGVSLEAVVVDDGGSDGTADEVASLEDTRIRLIRHEHSRGVSAARNAGLTSALGDWVAFIDDDDLWAPTKLRDQLSALNDHPEARWSATGAAHIDERYRVLAWHAIPEDVDLRAAVLASNVVPGGGSGLLVARALARDVGGFDEKISHLADWDFAIRLALESPIAPVHRPHVGYSVHVGGMAHHLAPAEAAFEYLSLKYRPQRAALGVDIDRLAWARYLAPLAFRGGATRLGARLRLREAFLSRRLRPLLTLATDLAPVDMTELRIRRTRAAAPAGWAVETAAWLATYR